MQVNDDESSALHQDPNQQNQHYQHDLRKNPINWPSVFEIEHDVTHVQKIGWARLRNGELIAHAERDGYVVLITADKNLRYQQSLKGRKISIIILNSRYVDFQGTVPLIPQ